MLIKCHCCVEGSPLQQRPHPVLLPLAGARLQDEAGGEWGIGEIGVENRERITKEVKEGEPSVTPGKASTGGDHRPVFGSDEGGVARPLVWQGGREAAAGCRMHFHR